MGLLGFLLRLLGEIQRIRLQATLTSIAVVFLASVSQTSPFVISLWMGAPFTSLFGGFLLPIPA